MELGTVISLLSGVVKVVLTNYPEGEEEWGRYQTRWTSWNHLRTVSCITACVCLAVSLI